MERTFIFCVTLSSMLFYGAGNTGLPQNREFLRNEHAGALSAVVTPAQAGKTMAGGTGPNDDFDGDGVINMVDLDDDNDGIPDQVECPGLFTNLAVDGGFTTTPTTSSKWYKGLAWSGNNYNYEVVGGAIYGYGDLDGQRNSPLTGGLFDEVDGNNTNSGIINALNEDPARPIIGKVGQLVSTATYEFSFDIALRGNSIENNQDYVVLLYNATSHMVEKEIVRKSLSSLYYYRTDAGWYEYLNGKAGYQTISGSFTPNATAQYYLVFSTEGPGNREDDFILDRVALKGGVPCDTDGDGLLNYLDSDGDGCPDAIEGGTNAAGDNIIAADLVHSSLDGGNTGSGYTGTSGPIDYNLGNTVDANGIPTIAPGGQALGTSQDKNSQPVNCIPATPPVAANDASMNNSPGSQATLDLVTNDTGGDPVDAATVNLIASFNGTCTDTDTDGDCDRLTVTGEGVWTVSSTGSMTFTPESGFTKDPTPITYMIKDNDGETSNTATIIVDYAPAASDDTGSGAKGATVTVEVLTNDKDGDIAVPTTVQIVGTANPGDPLVVPGQGIWSVNPTSGAISFAPESDMTGNPTEIRYTVKDDEGNISNPAQVSISYSQSSLPVTLKSFVARETSEGPLLSWVTVSEVDFDRFEIEKSSNPKTGFLTIGSVKGDGPAYSYLDQPLVNGVVYYRLKMIDLDNTFAYSKIINLELTSIKSVFTYPNPASSEVRINALNGTGLGNVAKVLFYDQAGLMRYSTSNIKNQIIDISNLSNGLYLIQIVAKDGTTYHSKVVVKK